MTGDLKTIHEEQCRNPDFRWNEKGKMNWIIKLSLINRVCCALSTVWMLGNVDDQDKIIINT